MQITHCDNCGKIIGAKSESIHMDGLTIEGCFLDDKVDLHIKCISEYIEKQRNSIIQTIKDAE
jgi:hypothetical protein